MSRSSGSSIFACEDAVKRVPFETSSSKYPHPQLLQFLRLASRTPNANSPQQGQLRFVCSVSSTLVNEDLDSKREGRESTLRRAPCPKSCS